MEHQRLTHFDCMFFEANAKNPAQGFGRCLKEYEKDLARGRKFGGGQWPMKEACRKCKPKKTGSRV